MQHTTSDLGTEGRTLVHKLIMRLISSKIPRETWSVSFFRRITIVVPWLARNRNTYVPVKVLFNTHKSGTYLVYDCRVFVAQGCEHTSHDLQCGHEKLVISLNGRRKE